MSTASTADAWRHGGGTPDRSFTGSRMPREERAMEPDRSNRSARIGRPPVPPRERSADSRPVPPRRESLRPSDRDPARSRPPAARPPAARPVDGRTEAARGRAEARPVAGGRIRGAVAVLGVFLVTLAGAGIDSYVGVGLGLITTAALLGSTAIATLMVRRRDLVSVVVSPPLVFVAVAALNIGLAPSATFNLPTVATLLIRGFPTMAMATGLALVLALGRLIARR